MLGNSICKYYQWHIKINFSSGVFPNPKDNEQKIHMLYEKLRC